MKVELNIKIEIDFTAEQAEIFEELRPIFKNILSGELVKPINEIVDAVKKKQSQNEFQNNCSINVE